jgi:hypothetical protein
MKKAMALFGILFCLTLVPITVWADSRTYKQPPKKGIIYVVVQFKPYNSRDLFPRTKVTVKWGSFTKSKSYSAAFTTKTVGVVIALSHNKDDSVPMTIESEGTVVSVEQLNSPPSESKSGNYQTDSW